MCTGSESNPTNTSPILDLSSAVNRSMDLNLNPSIEENTSVISKSTVSGIDSSNSDDSELADIECLKERVKDLTERCEMLETRVTELSL